MFFFSLFLIIGIGCLIFVVFKKIRIPALIGYLFLGILLKYFGLIDINLLNISSEIRKIALLIILVKAGLNLNLNDLKKVGRPAILLSFLPACMEMVTIGLIAPLFFNLDYSESFLLGAVLGAVSPAVVVPRMTRLMDERRGTAKGIPQMIVAGSSIDDIIMIVFFTAFLSLATGGDGGAMIFLNIPLSIVLGIAIGILCGFLLSLLFKYVRINTVVKIVIVLSIGFGLTYVETILPFGYSSLLSVIVIGITVLYKNKKVAEEMAAGCSNLWVVGEMFLFSLLGAAVEIDYLFKYLGLSLVVILIGLVVRMTAVQLSLIKTGLSLKEKTFVGISYLPKATVQASIGGELLVAGLSSGNAVIIAAGTIVLSIAVVSIVFTAPLSALVLDLTYRWFLSDDSNKSITEVQKPS